VNSDELAVMMGTLGPLAARWRSADALEATSPAAAAGVVLALAAAASASAADFGPRFGAGVVVFTVGPDIDGGALPVYPASPVAAGGLVAVGGWGGLATLECVFGGGSGAASDSTSNGSKSGSP